MAKFYVTWLSATALLLGLNAKAQNVGIGTALPQAKLDVVASDAGVLIPRVALSATNVAAPVAAPVTSTLVYNTATAGSGPTAVTPGFYYWNTANWTRLAQEGTEWRILGNAGTSPTTNFLGTTDNVGLAFRTNNVDRVRVTETGVVGIGTTTPLASNGMRLDVTGPARVVNALVVNTSSSEGGQIVLAGAGQTSTTWEQNNSWSVDVSANNNLRMFYGTGAANEGFILSPTGRVAFGGGSLADPASVELASTRRMHIESPNDLVIGQPIVRIHNRGSSAVSAASRLTLFNGTTGIATTDGTELSIDGGGVANLINRETLPLNLGTSNQTRVEITTQGFVDLKRSILLFGGTDQTHTGLGNLVGAAAIENAQNFGSLMILGRTTGPGPGQDRRISMWDRLEIGSSNFTTSAALYVNGGIRANPGSPVSNTGTNTGYTFGSDGDTGLFAEGGSPATLEEVNIYHSNAKRFTVAGVNMYMNGFVGIALGAAPAYRLELGQNSAAKPGSNTWTVPSDERLKTNMTPFTDGLSIASRIQPVWFEYNGKAGLPTGERFVGTRAQELQEVAPFMLKPLTRTHRDGSTEEYLSVDYGAMDFILLNSVKELAEQVKQLNNRVTELETENNRLRQEIQPTSAQR